MLLGSSVRDGPGATGLNRPQPIKVSKGQDPRVVRQFLSFAPQGIGGAPATYFRVINDEDLRAMRTF